MGSKEIQSDLTTSNQDRLIASRLILARAKLELKRGELASLSGVSEENIAEYENASKTIPASDLFLLSTSMGLSIEYFYNDAEVKVPNLQINQEETASA